jgi:hypothetical protein
VPARCVRAPLLASEAGSLLQIAPCATKRECGAFKIRNCRKCRNNMHGALKCVLSYAAQNMYNDVHRPPTPAMRAAAKMPLLEHYHRGRPFDIAESDVAAWLCAQPEIRQQVFNMFKANGSIVFDMESRQWRGADTQS